jgi:hypothetical protein
VFKLSNGVTDGFIDLTALLIGESHGEARSSNIKDHCGFIWPGESQVGVTEEHIEFSHFKLTLSLIFDHKTSPGTNQVAWSDFTTRGVAGLLDHTRLVLLALEGFHVAFHQLWCGSTVIASLFMCSTALISVVAFLTFWSIWVSLVALIF